jgi:hypothetical protein
MARKILFSGEKRFEIDEIYNRQNDRIFAPSREQADESGRIHRKTKFPQGVMIWLEVCYDGVTRPVIIKDVLPIELKDVRRLIGNEFTFQQDSAPTHKDHHTQTWCKDHFWNFWSTSRWPPNSPDLNPLGYLIWHELSGQMNWNKITNEKNVN